MIPFPLPVRLPVTAGLWTAAGFPPSITVVGFGLRPQGLVDIYFDKASWHTDVHGLVYTSDGFEAAVRQLFVTLGAIDCESLQYTEQGMQSDDRISMEASREFVLSLSCDVPIARAFH